MLSCNKMQKLGCGMRGAYKLAAVGRLPMREYSKKKDVKPQSQLSQKKDKKPQSQLQSPSLSVRTPARSAVAQLAQTSDCSTVQETPQEVHRTVDIEHVRSKINELDQRKMRHLEYAEMIKLLYIKPSTFALEPKLPFKKPAPAKNLRRSLRNCTSVDEVLELTDNLHQLAHEMIKLSSELANEKRKNDVVVESYLELKREMLNSKKKSN